MKFRFAEQTFDIGMADTLLRRAQRNPEIVR